jgi:C4-dicarboxylate-specific signal transduction histidine kinase
LEDAYQTLRENQQKLLIAEKMASLGRITAGIAHEMNTPLAATRAALRKATQLADEYKLSIDDPEVTDDDHKEIADEIISVVKLADTAAERAASFVRDIKIQTRNFKPLKKQTINVGRVIEDSLLLLYHALENKECKVDYQSSHDNIQVLGPPGRLEQIVTNLVNNAIDACVSEGGEISIKLDQHEGYVELQVSDNGSGISSENLPKIFDPMFSTKPFGTSTGLGLTIVHDIVVGDFNGSIDVQSQVGEGTTFTIHIPIGK